MTLSNLDRFRKALQHPYIPNNFTNLGYFEVLVEQDDPSTGLSSSNISNLRQCLDARSHAFLFYGEIHSGIIEASYEVINFLLCFFFVALELFNQLLTDIPMM